MKGTVLVVDDEAGVIRLLEAVLTAEGFSVIEAGEVGDAWRAIQDNVPDAAIVDLQLPGVFGWELVQRMRRDDRMHDTPIIIMSGRIEPEDVHRAHQMACTIVQKPFEPTELADRLQSMIDGGRSAGRKLRVQLWTGGVWIEGDLFLPEVAGRFSDSLEDLIRDRRSFIPLTDAQIKTASGEIANSVPFLEVAKSHIAALLPPRDA